MSERVRWRKVRRADGYKVSSSGDVKSPGGVLTPVPDKDGYPRVTLAGEKVKVMHLVLEAFVSPRPFGLEACHDPKRSKGREDCRLEVLRWDSHRGNERDKLKTDSRYEWEGSPPSPPVTPVTGDVLR